MVSHAVWKNMALGPQLRQKPRLSSSVFVYWVPRAMFFTRHGRPWSNPTTHLICARQQGDGQPIPYAMITSSNGNIVHVTGPLCGEFTGHRWITHTKASDAELWCFLWSAPRINVWVNNCEAGDLRRHRAHYDVIVMILFIIETNVNAAFS